MGWDEQYVYILFGVKLPEDDVLRVLRVFTTQDTIKRPLKIPNTTYHIVNHGDYYIALISPRFGVGEDNCPESSYKIIPPTEEQVLMFMDFLKQYEIDYPYAQYLLV